MKSTYLYIILSLFISTSIFAQQIEKSTTGTFMLKDAEIYTITKGIVKGDVLIKDGMIQQVGEITDDNSAKVIDCAGKRIYPGFIDSGTRLGLVEISSVSLTQDHSELGMFTPHMKALTAVNPSSVSIPVTRTNGVTTVITKPSGGRFPGTAALIDLHGYTPDQMYGGFECIYMNYPSSGRRGRWDRRTDDEIKTQKEKDLKTLAEIWDKTYLYHQIDSARVANREAKTEYNPQMDALLPVIRGEQKIMIEVSKKSDILAAIELVNKFKLDAIFSGVSEGWRVTDSLVKYNIPVITGPVLSLPARNSDKYDRAYENASLMSKAGVKVAIRTNQEENVRNLPFDAGFAATYGMGIDKALEAITIVPAQIFGVADKYGSIEAGKIANLFICDGDPFEMKTTISHLFIKGWNVPMESRHTLLYDEFLDRSPGIKE